MTLPTLYKKSPRNQKLLTWTIHVDEKFNNGNGAGLIVTIHGEEGGKLQEGTDLVVQGKNAGKANATTAYQQACAEARSKWNRQVERKGYVEDRAKAAAGETDQEGYLAPMLAHRYDKCREKYASWPAWVQPKLDGIRGVIHVRDGVVEIHSRTRGALGLGLLHLRAEVARLFPAGEHLLDGEFYHHLLKADFEKIASYVNDTKYQPGNEIVQYHCYDYPSAPGGFGARHAALQERLRGSIEFNGCRSLSEVVVPVATMRILNEEAFDVLYRSCLEDGYEGAMYRADAGEYEGNQRSYHLLKIKPLYEEVPDGDDKVFPIVAVRPGRGKFAGAAIFTCETPSGVLFEVTAPGDMTRKASYLADEATWRGKVAEVRYGNLTALGVPRFPVAHRVRERGQ